MGHSRVIKVLLDANAEVDKQHINGTPLLFAINGGPEYWRELYGEIKLNGGGRETRERAVEILLEGGAEVDKPSEPLSRTTALFAAVERGLDNVVDVLLKSNANVNLDVETLALDSYSFRGTALHLASKKGNFRIVEMLLGGNAVVDKQDSKGRTALSWAASSGHGRVVERLLEAKADVENRDQNGRTALHWAAANGKSRVVEILVRAGAVDSQTNEGKTALQMAREKGQETNEGKTSLEMAMMGTSLQMAREKGQDAVVEILQKSMIVE